MKLGTIVLTEDEANVVLAALSNVQIGGTVGNANNIINTIRLIQGLQQKLATAFAPRLPQSVSEEGNTPSNPGSLTEGKETPTD